MDKLFEAFPKSSTQDWIELLKKELKGADFETSLIKTDEIEGITYPSFFHKDDVLTLKQAPGVFPYRRGFNEELNDWSIIGELVVVDEKQANEKALSLLMKGCTALHFDIKKQNPDIAALLKDVKSKYIKIFITCSNENDYRLVSDFMSNSELDEVFFSLNPLELNKTLGTPLFVEPKAGILRSYHVDAYSIQQCGANASEELAFTLSLGHSYLFEQIKSGLTVDDALMNMHVTLGVGSNFLIEVAKFRAFRMLWSKIARSYKPAHVSSETIQVTAKTGFINKSLADPYTNLLRQTTEVMSAVLGGASHICNQAYDKLSVSGSSEFAERMAINTSLILKEESYLHQVLDAVGGSYAIEALTEKLAEKAWSLFHENEEQGVILSTNLKNSIEATAQKRVDAYVERRKTLIGVNKFPNPESSSLIWNNQERSYFGLKLVTLEETIVKQPAV